jgi:hypothetical protein
MYAAETSVSPPTDTVPCHLHLRGVRWGQTEREGLRETGRHCYLMMGVQHAAVYLPYKRAIVSSEGRRMKLMLLRG